jgi:predicted nucleotidyltransferase
MTPEAEIYREKLRAMLPELQEKYGVAELGLFGSRIRGDHRPDSDLDVLVDFQSDRIPGLIRFCSLENTMSARLGVRVDLVPKNSLKPLIGRHVLREVQYL